MSQSNRLSAGSEKTDVSVELAALAMVRDATGADAFWGLLEDCCEDLQAMLKDLGRAAQAKAPDVMRKMAHRICGLADLFGLVALASACRAVEDAEAPSSEDIARVQLEGGGGIALLRCVIRKRSIDA